VNGSRRGEPFNLSLILVSERVLSKRETGNIVLIKSSMLKYDAKEQKEIEKAVVFMVSKFGEYCKNKKPVILHSINVGLGLMDLKQSIEIVQAGILHDLVEDSNCTIGEIEKEFGKSVGKMVVALTLDEKILDYKKRWYEAITRIIDEGKDVMMIKIIDNMQNLPYYIKISDQKVKKDVIWKHQYTITNFKKYLEGNKIFEKYEKMVNETSV